MQELAGNVKHLFRDFPEARAVMRFPELYKIRLAQRQAERERRADRKPSRSGVSSEHGITRAYVEKSAYHRKRIEALRHTA